MTLLSYVARAATAGMKQSHSVALLTRWICSVVCVCDQENTQFDTAENREFNTETVTAFCFYYFYKSFK